MRRLFGHQDTSLVYIINGSLAGLAVLLEHPSKQLEMAYYCLPRAIESFWKMGVTKGWWISLPYGEVFVFCIGTGVLMGLYQERPESISSGYRKLLTRFFGHT